LEVLVRLLFFCYGHLGQSHSFPTRRSSDLRGGRSRGTPSVADVGDDGEVDHRELCVRQAGLKLDVLEVGIDLEARQEPRDRGLRSEEHTSELQSLAYLVCRLLLEKKKRKRH